MLQYIQTLPKSERGFLLLDKSIPYAELWMYRTRDLPINEYSLPEGFQFAFYQEGDEQHWAEIETSVSEFEDVAQALAYFERNYAPYPKALKERMLFVTNASGEKIATCSAWWKETSNGERFPLLHWVAVKPEYQGKGIAKAMVSHTLVILEKLEHASPLPIYLHTQTWSHPAIRLYQKLGFEITDRNLDGSPNPDYEKAMTILDGKGISRIDQQ